MQKEIRYNGFTEQPSDYECPDGDLAAVSGLVPEDEALRPIAEPQPLFTLPDGCLISYIHAGIGYKHYVIKHEYDAEIEGVSVHKTDFYWLDSAAIDSAAEKPVIFSLPFPEGSLIHSFDNITTYKVDGIGNTIVILTDSGMHYCLWQNQAYKYLGNHLPEIQLSFGMGLAADPYEDYQTSIPFDVYPFPNDRKWDLTNNVFGHINDWIYKNHQKGYFIFPFFVRYAYRLYDGNTLVMHSAPILMMPNTFAPHVLVNQALTRPYFVIEKPYQLDYAVYEDAGQEFSIAKLQEWSDIIQSVDIFISAPIQTYNQNGLIEGSTQDPWQVISSRDFSVCQQMPELTAIKYPYGLYYMGNQWQRSIRERSVGYPVYLNIPMKSEQEVYNELKNCHTFYFLKSLKLDALSGVRTPIVEEGYLPNIYQYEVMTDDWDSHDLLIPKYSFVYNQRLNLAGIIKQLTLAYHTKAALPFSDDYVEWHFDTTPVSYEYKGDQRIYVYVYIKKDGRDIVVKSNDTLAGFGVNHPIPYYYYPDKDAYKAIIIYVTNNGSGFDYTAREIKLTQHPYLNGAFFFAEFGDTNGKSLYPGEWVTVDLDDQGHLVIPEEEQNRIISLPNRIYTSEVNNPFAFPVKGITTIGTGSILGIKAAVKALSPSQFGQFPLYAFCTDGVWALTVSSDGSYSASQPTTLDVCISADSITQIESAVLFATQRGIMLISGSTSTCISDNINSKLAFDLDTLPGLRQLIGEEIADSLDHVHFIEYLQQARMLFDYTHQRIIVYNPNHNYAYAYSLKSKQWGMLLSYIKDAPNSYPDALAFAELPTEGGGQTNTILNYSAEKAGADYTGTKKLIITRPLKLDIADQLKTIDTIIQRGQFRKGHVKTILYGSRDLFNWQLIYSSTDHYLRGFRGTPYKYFRIVLLCEGMTPDESIFGCSVEYQPRLTGKLR